MVSCLSNTYIAPKFIKGIRYLFVCRTGVATATGSSVFQNKLYVYNTGKCLNFKKKKQVLKNVGGGHSWSCVLCV